MTCRSFRLVTLALTVAILAGGCGGTAKPKAQVVSAAGFRFSAPTGWPVTRHGTRVTAGSGDRLVEVSVFTLVKPYRPALFTAVAGELKVRMDALASRLGGTVRAAGVAAPAGIESHVWRLSDGGHVDEYTFVLKGRTEYQLLCRRPTGGSDDPCRQLVATFALG
jgi:hypothetical protein